MSTLAYNNVFNCSRSVYLFHCLVQISKRVLWKFYIQYVHHEHEKQINIQLHYIVSCYWLMV